MERAFLIPREGLLVRDPKSKNPLAAEGETKIMTGPVGRYWRRRVKCGDCRIGSPPQPVPSSSFQRAKRSTVEDES